MSSRVYHAYMVFGSIIGAILILLIASAVRAEVYVDMEIIKVLESGGDPHAYNRVSGATGIFQVTKICLTDYNEKICKDVKDHHKKIICIFNSKYTMEEMYDPVKNKYVSEWYFSKRIPQLLKYSGHEDTLDSRLVAYNCGVKCIGKPLPKETRRYIRDYRKLSHGR